MLSSSPEIDPSFITRGQPPAAVTAATLVEPQHEAAYEIVRTLKASGVSTYFGVPGGPIMPFFDAILKTPGIHLVESRHETNAAFAAAGYWRATGKVPAVVVTSGPGATNVVTGIVSAYLERVPLLLICGDVAWSAARGVALQSLGQESIGIEEMLRNVTRAAVRVSLPRSAPTQALAALRAAADPINPGPALLVLPIDCAILPISGACVEHVGTSVTSHLDDEIVVDVARRLVGAERPLVVVGAGCRSHADRVREMIERLRVPFVTTPRGKGIISEEHPCSLRNFGMGASWWARRYTARHVDATLVLGTDLDDVSVAQTPPIGSDGTLIHVDLDSTVFSRNWPAKIAIACDLRVFAERLQEVASLRGLAHRRSPALLAEAKRDSPFDEPGFRVHEAPHLAPYRVVHDLEVAAGPHTTFVTDIGEHMLFALHYLTAKGPQDFVIHLGLGSMASGICSAIGHALGNGKRRVVCICGDGGMQMAGSELLVALKLRLPIVYAVLNDARYNMVYHGYKQQFGREASWDSPQIDFAQWAKAHGIPGARIDRPGQITADLLDRMTANRLPAVLDIRHDAAVRIRGAGRIETLQQMAAFAPPNRA